MTATFWAWVFQIYFALWVVGMLLICTFAKSVKEPKRCQKCGGEGYLVTDDGGYGGNCPTCHGRGWL